MSLSPADVAEPSVNTTPSTYEAHPCADVFPMMSDAELDDLAQDIKANGQRQPVVLWVDKDDRQWLLDGRNRVEALKRVGIDPVVTVRAPPGGGDPVAYVISTNIRRRHLTKAQQAELILLTVEAGHKAAADSASLRDRCRGMSKAVFRAPVRMWCSPRRSPRRRSTGSASAPFTTHARRFAARHAAASGE